jgi:Tol biopolymer transport system component
MAPFRRTVLGAQLLIIACAFGIVFAQTAQAAWPGANGRIVFLKEDFLTTAAQIYSMKSDGTDEVNLTAAGGASIFDLQPSVSPNGKRIVFTRAEFTAQGPTGQLWTMNMDGTHQIDISNNPLLASESGPSWTEDGSKILFVEAPFGTFPAFGGSIWIRKADGTGTPRQLTPGPSDANPAMSPDGDLIAFSRPVNGPRHLFLMKSDGSGPATDLGQGAKPDWSPDSKRIVYGQGGPAGPIMVMKISDPAHPQKLAGFGNEAPAWSPDGTQIAFIHFYPANHSYQIWLMSANGSNQHEITSDPTSSNQKPSWQSVRSREGGQAGH